MAIKVKMKKIVSNHANLRTPEVTGILRSEIRLGQSLVMTSEALNGDPSYHREVTTSPIKKIRVFTENSVYELEAFKEDLV